MTTALPWHHGDLAVTSDGWRWLVVRVRDGTALAIVESFAPHDDVDPLLCPTTVEPLPADAVPDLTDAGTAARWLRSCAEALRPHQYDRRTREFQIVSGVKDQIRAASMHIPWNDPDPALVARAVEATRAYLAIKR